jgi:predicted AAA+ superfamily ATPase
VLEKDIDGERAETTDLENREPRFGAVNAARRVARTIFLGSAPVVGHERRASAGSTGPRAAGLPAAWPALVAYSDALNRLADRLHYLNSSGDKAQDATRFWFDTRANLRREMEDRKQRFDDRSEVRTEGRREVLKKLSAVCRCSTASTSSRPMRMCLTTRRCAWSC